MNNASSPFTRSGRAGRLIATLVIGGTAAAVTANVVLNMAFGERTMAVDTHVFRVGNRTGLAPGNTPLDVELGLERVIPSEFMLHAHHWLILHGRYVCKARRPECWRCIVRDLCAFKPKTPPPVGVDIVG